jgi:hypothetical protein
MLPLPTAATGHPSRTKQLARLWRSDLVLGHGRSWLVASGECNRDVVCSSLPNWLRLQIERLTRQNEDKDDDELEEMMARSLRMQVRGRSGAPSGVPEPLVWCPLWLPA